MVKKQDKTGGLKRNCGIMKQHGITNREMIGVYGFDEDVVNLVIEE